MRICPISITFVLPRILFTPRLPATPSQPSVDRSRPALSQLPPVKPILRALAANPFAAFFLPLRLRKCVRLRRTDICARIHKATTEPHRTAPVCQSSPCRFSAAKDLQTPSTETVAVRKGESKMPEIWLPKKAWLSPFALRKRNLIGGAGGCGGNGLERRGAGPPKRGYLFPGALARGFGQTLG